MRPDEHCLGDPDRLAVALSLSDGEVDLVRSAEAAGAEQIAKGARLIRELAKRLRTPQGRNLPIARPDGTVDPRATAFMMGLSEEKLLEHWQARRRQTAWLSWGCFGLTWLFLIMWGLQTVTAPWGTGRLISALQVLPSWGVLSSCC